MTLIVGLIVLACSIVVLGVMIRIGAAILRISVSLTNGVLGGRDLVEDDYRHRASVYETIPQPKSLGGVRIPVPGVGYAILVNFGCAVASALCQFAAIFVAVALLGMAVPETTDPFDPTILTGMVGLLAVGFGASVFGTLLVLKLALPTTFVRAGVVVFWQYLVCALLGAALVGVVFLLGATDSGKAFIPTRPGTGGWVR